MTIATLAILALLAVCATLGRGVVALAARWVLVVVAVALLVALLAGCAPPPRVQVQAPAWMVTPVPTTDVGVDALHAWNCVTAPETICTEWRKPVTN